MKPDNERALYAVVSLTSPIRLVTALSLVATIFMGATPVSAAGSSFAVAGGIRPPTPACPPTVMAGGSSAPPASPSIVTIPDGTQVTCDDIAQFDARWMQPNPDGTPNGYQDATYLWTRDVQAMWGISPRMTALARMYELTHAPRYVEALQWWADALLNNRDDAFTGNPSCWGCTPYPKDDFYGQTLPAWGYNNTDTGHLNEINQLASSLYAYDIATFARIVAEDPALQPTYGVKAVDDANKVLQTVRILLPWMQSRQVGNFQEAYLRQLDSFVPTLVMDPEVRPTLQECQYAAILGTGKYSQQDALALVALAQAAISSGGLDPWASLDRACNEQRANAGHPFAHNEMEAYIMALIEVWRVIDSPYYQASPLRWSDADQLRAEIPVLVARHQRYFVDHLQVVPDTRGERYYWHYADDDIGCCHAEDSTHGEYDMLYLDVLRRNFDRLNASATAQGEPIPLDDTQLQRFANTFLEKVATEPNFAYDVTGRTAPAAKIPGINRTCDGWVNLTVVDPRVYGVCREMSLRVLPNNPDDPRDPQGPGQYYLTVANHSALLMNKHCGHVTKVEYDDPCGRLGVVPAQR